jgi:hypothetical protein
LNNWALVLMLHPNINTVVADVENRHWQYMSIDLSGSNTYIVQKWVIYQCHSKLDNCPPPPPPPIFIYLCSYSYICVHIHIFVFTDNKNNRFQKKLITQNTNIRIWAPAIIELATGLYIPPHFWIVPLVFTNVSPFPTNFHHLEFFAHLTQIQPFGLQKISSPEADLPWFVRGGGDSPEGGPGVHYYGVPGPFTLTKCFKFEALKCHFLHSEQYIYSLNLYNTHTYSLNLYSTRTLGKKFKNAMLYCNPPYWRLNIFLHIFENSNMEYQSFLQGGAHPNGRPASVHPPFLSK